MKYNKIFISILTVLLSTINTSQLFSQIFDYEQPSPKVKWRQINSPNFQLIYPQEFESRASLLAQQIQTMLDNASEDLKIKPKKISIIFQENHIEQNGFVQLAPRKVELYSTPGPATDNTAWLPNLIQHELRHVAQFDKLTGKIKGPFFEQLALALYGIHLPAWYFEGDAVDIETRFSNGGRGRSNDWFLPLKANLLSGRNYTFSKNIIGSYKDITPSYYLTGYVMNAYLNNTKGEAVKEQILKDMSRHLLRPYNFNLALKKHTGLYSHQLHQISMDSLNKEWQTSWKNQEGDLLANQDDRYFSSYFLPQTNGSNLIYALKESPQRIDEIVEIEGEKQKSILKLGYQLRPYFNINNNNIVWDETRRDARFGKQTYNIIRIFDFKTKKSHDLSKNSRFYSPIIDANSQNVYAVHVNENNVSSLVKIEISTKSVSEIINLADGSQLLQPSLNSDNTKIVAIVIGEKGNNLIEIDLQTGATRWLLRWSNQELERPVYSEKGIVFKGQSSDADNLFLLDNSDNQLYQISQSQLGFRNPSIGNQGEILYNSYRYNGYKMAKLNLNTVEKTRISLLEYVPTLVDSTVKEPYFLPNSAENVGLTSKKYSPWSHFLNFHSLSISANNFESFDNYKPGIFWIANDLLHTSQLKLGYEYDLEREKSTYSAEISYQRYFPKLTFAYKNRGMVGQAKVANKPNETINFDYREHVYTLDLQLPFQKYRGKDLYSYGLNFGTSYQKRYDLSLNTIRSFQYEIAFPLNYQVYFNRNQRRSNLDLVPRWGQNISFVYRHVPFSNNMNGQYFSLKSNFYFPGFYANHAFQARFSWQHGDGRYLASNELPMVGGWAHFKSEKVDNTLLLNYRFPIAYPDWSIGPLAYVKRFHGYLFSDHQNVGKNNLAPASYGVGLSVDFNLLRYKLPDFGFGSKLSYINHPSARGKIVPSFSFNYSY